MRPKINSIPVTDGDSRSCTVTETLSQIDASDLSGPKSLDGLASYKAADGETLNREGDTFVGIHTGKRYRKA